MREIHYTLYDMRDWRWKNFTPKEIACNGTGLLLIDEDFMDKLQAFRDAYGKPIILNSAYRSEIHNRNVGGAPRSQHRLGRAGDIKLFDDKGNVIITREDVHRIAKLAGFDGFGDYNTFVHIDTGRPRYWDKRR